MLVCNLFVFEKRAAAHLSTSASQIREAEAFFLVGLFFFV